MRERTTLNAAIILVAGALLTIVVPAATPMAEAQDTPKEVYEPAQALPAEAYAAKAGAAYAIGMLAYIWGYPLMDMYRLRDYYTAGPRPGGLNSPINQFTHARVLMDDKYTGGQYPNIDTLHSSVWLDLAKEPQILHIPDTKGRYYLVPLVSAYNEIFASIGARTKGYGAKTYAIVGPNWKGVLPKDVEEVRSPTNVVWVFIRNLISGPEELDAVHTLQNGYTIQPLSDFTAGKAPTPPKGFPDGAKESETKTMPDGIAYFEKLNEILQTEAVPEHDHGLLNFFSLIGIGPGADFATKAADPAIKAGLLRAAATADRLLKERIGRMGYQVNGWQVSDFGRYPDYLVRGAVSWMGGTAANLPEDAVSSITYIDADGKPLDGRNRYVLRFERGQTPPVDAFWSLTMYDMSQNLVTNPLKRFRIGDRTRGLTYGDDGSLTVYIQSERPPNDLESNWLPAPLDRFVMILRAYSPRKAIVDHSYQWPPVQKPGE